MKPKLDEIELTREQSEALIERIENDRLSEQDRQLLTKLTRVFFWLTLTLRETKISRNYSARLSRHRLAATLHVATFS